ncbi:MAG: molybdopterin molybdotransferase MoeA, partial [Chloroflexi bacterium]|nr:molybdopterin molybdotransferase MoeA [Chloroflexota bacterium]
MLSVEEALDRILARIPTLPPERKPLLDALGQVLAEEIVADLDLPQVANSAMDGYAVRAADTGGADRDRPCVLAVVGEVVAGREAAVSVGPGQAVRIMTGGMLPAGADAVVPFEATDEAALAGRIKPSGLPERVTILAPARPGQAVRPPGEDVRRGQVVFSAGRTLRPAEIAVLAAIGRAEVAVIRRPVVAILGTGDELVEPGGPIGPGQVYNSNAYGLAAAVRQAGGIPRVLGIARDSLNAVRAKVEEAFGDDLLLTSGGVSKGDRDFVRDVLADLGEVTLWSINMRPGKPLAFGLLR